MRTPLLMLALLLLTSCGVNLAIIKQRLRVKLPDGVSHSVRVVERVEHGPMQPDFDSSVVSWLPQTVIGVLVEPLDMISSTAIAINAMFDPDRDVAGGPIGWLAAMTPFATLMPQIKYGFIFGRRIDASQWQLLSSDDEADRRSAARQIWPTRNITYVHPMVEVAADNAPDASGGN